jgi:hypothetical protein
VSRPLALLEGVTKSKRPRIHPVSDPCWPVRSRAGTDGPGVWQELVCQVHRMSGDGDEALPSRGAPRCLSARRRLAGGMGRVAARRIEMSCILGQAKTRIRKAPAAARSTWLLLMRAPDDPDPSTAQEQEVDVVYGE